MAPNAAGLVYSPGSQTLSVLNADSAQYYACAFDQADSEVFFKWALNLRLGAGAGVALSFCVPSDDPGICLEGAINFVSLAVTPTVTQTNHLLLRGGVPFGYRSQMRREVPWSLTVLDGGIYAKLNLWIFSARWPIITFSGYKVAGGYLQEPIDTSVHWSL